MKIANTIENEDQPDKSSPLYSLKKEHPFRVENTYFDTLHSNITEQVVEYEELKEDAPVLASIPKYNPFEVPSNYFETVPLTIQNRIHAAKYKFSIKEWLLEFIRPNFVLPVSIVLFFSFMAIHTLTIQTTTEKPTLTSAVSLEEGLYTIDEGLLIDLLQNEIRNEDNFHHENTAIMEYLIDNNIDAEYAFNNTTFTHEN